MAAMRSVADPHSMSGGHHLRIDDDRLNDRRHRLDDSRHGLNDGLWALSPGGRSAEAYHNECNHGRFHVILPFMNGRDGFLCRVAAGVASNTIATAVTPRTVNRPENSRAIRIFGAARRVDRACAFSQESGGRGQEAGGRGQEAGSRGAVLIQERFASLRRLCVAASPRLFPTVIVS